MDVQPFFEWAEFFLYCFDPFRIVNGSFDLQPVANDAGILQQLCDLPFIVAGNFFNVEVIKGFKKIVFLFQDRFPT